MARHKRGKKQRGGREAIFKDKTGGDRIQGIISRVGSVKFEEARQRLKVLAERPRNDVSDGDCAEYLARGEENTRAYLAERKLVK